jgi:hypothetical protein
MREIRGAVPRLVRQFVWLLANDHRLCLEWRFAGEGYFTNPICFARWKMRPLA